MESMRQCVGHFLHFIRVSCGFISYFASWKKMLSVLHCEQLRYFVKHSASHSFPTGGEAATAGFVPGTRTFLWYSVPVGWWLICSSPANAHGSLWHDEGYVFWRLPREQCKSCKFFSVIQLSKRFSQKRYLSFSYLLYPSYMTCLS
jgi:hypothetical protein